MSVSSDTTCTDAGTAASDFLLDFISECGDCNKIESMTLNEKAQLCSRLKESLCFVQKSSLEQEKEEANERAHEVFNKCDVCKLVSDSRQRKQAEIRQIYLQVLDKKPAELLCTPGIFSRLETMASKGLFDAVVAEGQRCSKCRQVSANQILLTSEVVEILQQEIGSSGHCCVERACSKCLRFVVTSLGHQVTSEECTEEIPKSITNTIGQGQDYLKEMAEDMKLMREEMKTNNKDQLKPTLECHMKNLLVQQDAQIKTLSAQHTENLSCLQNMNEGLQKICQKLDSRQAEIKNSSPLSVDEIITMPLNLAPFSGEAWQSPRLAIRMWQENLKKSGSVKEEWCGLVFEALEGNAMDWCSEQDLTDVTWEQFTQLFVAHFDRDMKRVVNEYLKSVLANDEGIYEVHKGRWMNSFVDSHGQKLQREERIGNFFWMDNSDVERFLLACLRALDDNLKNLLYLFNAQFSVENYKVQIYNTIAIEPKVNSVTTYTELLMVLQKRAPDDYKVDSIKHHNEMKSVANNLILNTCSASVLLDQLYF